MKYKALKNCKFDRRYSVGELIDGSVIDQKCLPRAVKFGYIEKSDSVEEVEEEPQQKRRGRKKADGGM